MFKNWITNMSAFEMTFLMIGIATPVVFIIAIFYTFRGSATAMKTAKVFLTREKWPGKLHNTRIVSCSKRICSMATTSLSTSFFISIIHRNYILQKLSLHPRSCTYSETTACFQRSKVLFLIYLKKILMYPRYIVQL